MSLNGQKMNTLGDELASHRFNYMCHLDVCSVPSDDICVIFHKVSVL
jgi:hypothetical protein